MSIKPVICLDITTSVEHFSATAHGILRTEREYCKALLDKHAEGSVEAHFIFYNWHIADRGFVELPYIIVRWLCDPLNRAHHAKALAQEFSMDENDWLDGPLPRPVQLWRYAAQFGEYDHLINAGGIWPNTERFAIIAEQKRTHNFQFHAIVYDLVPILYPEYCTPELSGHDTLPTAFAHSLYLYCWEADTIICISQATKDDLQKIIAQFDLPTPKIIVNILGLCLDEAIVPAYPSNVSTALDDGFVLCVGTVEPRKNIAMLYQIWRTLYQRHFDIYKPLVLVGNIGWGSEQLERILTENHLLHKNPIIRISKVPDTQLQWLYQHCNFTIYPSFYEGWGLPVSESLLHGKYCITSNTSSLPESGNGLCAHIDPIDGEGFLREIVKCLSNRDYIHTKEQAIATTMKSRSWQESANDFYHLSCGASK